jgi:hypothetical protein
MIFSAEKLYDAHGSHRGRTHQLPKATRKNRLYPQSSPMQAVMRTPKARLSLFANTPPLLLAGAAGLGALGLFATPVALGQISPGGVHSVSGEVPPAIPMNVSAVAMLDGGYRVSWADSSFEEGGYEIERSPAFPERIRRVNANVVQATDTQLLPVARYRVRTVGRALRSDWSPWVEARSVAASFARLAPGRGFTAPTPVPAPVGTSGALGYDAKAIARWDVVPFQTFSGNFVVGVVAFHMNGIERVDFSVNGGPWMPVTEMKLNPATGVMGYNALLRAADFPTGRLEVRAVVIPRTAGEARVLGGDINAQVVSGEHSMVLFANARRTMAALTRYVSPTGQDSNDGRTSATPKRSVTDAIYSMHEERRNVDGATVYLLPGEHVIEGASWPRSQMANSQRWLTIEAMPGTPRDGVTVRGAGADNRLGFVKLLRWRNVKMAAVTGAEVVGSWEENSRVWYDNVIVDGVDRRNTTANGVFGWTSWGGGKYITDSVVRNLRDGTTGFALVRNVAMNGILSDAFSSSALVINSSVTDINPFTTDVHPDIVQFHGGDFRNVILYGLESDQNFQYANGVQGIFFSRAATHTDVAVVDCDISNTPSWSQALILEGPVTNLYVSGSRINGPAGYGENLTTRNVMFQNVHFTRTQPAPRPGVIFRNSQQ